MYASEHLVSVYSQSDFCQVVILVTKTKCFVSVFQRIIHNQEFVPGLERSTVF